MGEKDPTRQTAGIGCSREGTWEDGVGVGFAISG